MRETKVKIDPFGFVCLEDIEIDQKVNEHARAMVYGLLDSEHMDEYQEMLLNDDLWVKIRIFGESHVDEAAEALNLKVLGKVPVDPAYAEAADKGEFHTVKNPYLEVEFE